MADFGKKFYVEDLAELFGLPDSESVRELNDEWLHDSWWKPAYEEALDEGLSEEDAEEAGAEAESEGLDELYANWINAVESAVSDLFEEHGLELVEVTRGTFKLTPEKSWNDAAAKIIETINGVGYFHFNSVKEFLDSGPYTPKVAVIEHLGWIKDYPEVYGESSVNQRYHRAWR
jgi:hypothetical protein